MADHLEHLLVAGYTDSQKFQSTLKVIPDPIPQRNRGTHGNRLLGQLSTLVRREKALKAKRLQMGFPTDAGMAITLEIKPKGALDYFKKLEWKKDGIEVLSATDGKDREYVTLYIPSGRLFAFEKRVKEYLEQDNNPRKPGQIGKPKNATLINAISGFRRAAFEQLWTDREEPPARLALSAYQVWLVAEGQNPRKNLQAFLERAAALEIKAVPGFRKFPGRIVVAVHATRAALENALDLLDFIAEIRGSAPTAAFFTEQLKPYELAEWIEDLSTRVETVPDSHCITILDTGINAHPLLNQILDLKKSKAVRPAWGTADHHGHGTQMAGICAYGDLTAALLSQEQHTIPCKLESVNIFPPDGENDPALYGWVVEEAVRLVEEADKEEHRTFAMMTTAVGATEGYPSEWSASIDQLSFGIGFSEEIIDLPDDKAKTEAARLFVLSAGNVRESETWIEYPAINDVSPIEDPAQSWNALAVGACTDLVQLDPDRWPSLRLLAQEGGLSPSSRTSLMWYRAWPLKPDVVAEGGNGSFDVKYASTLSGPESVRQLTTSRDAMYPLVETGDTSAAAAEAARACAFIASRYPHYWPETVRALIVHGAKWTNAMLANYPAEPKLHDKHQLLRRYGYGKVSIADSIDSRSQKPTLVLQEEIIPYIKGDNGDTVLGNLNMHELPWPTNELEALQGTQVRLKITLSYFIEPNPSRRGWRSRYRYQSHGLRFAVKGATESDDRFKQRINNYERIAASEQYKDVDRDELDETDKAESIPDPDVKNWALGSRVRSRGSIHCDIWEGAGQLLASKSHIAIFPVGGWWKDAGRQSETVRYSLVVSLEVMTETNIDLYTPIAVELGITVPTEVAVPTGGPE